MHPGATRPFAPPSPVGVSSVLVLLFTLMEPGLKHRAGETEAEVKSGEVKGPGKQDRHGERWKELSVWGMCGGATREGFFWLPHLPQIIRGPQPSC